MVTALRKHPLPTRCGLLLALITASLVAKTVQAAGNDRAPLRKEKISTIVIHAIGGPICKNNKVEFTEAPGDAIKWKNWFEQQKSVSIHYIVDQDGQVAQSIDENRVAWHANDFNRRSIGIELVNTGDGVEAYPERQVTALTALVKGILKRYKTIRKHHIVRHSDIDNRKSDCGGRKVDLKQDPGRKFPYEAFISGL